jgi:hypothetical protein
MEGFNARLNYFPRGTQVYSSLACVGLLYTRFLYGGLYGY